MPEDDIQLTISQPPPSQLINLFADSKEGLVAWMKALWGEKKQDEVLVIKSTHGREYKYATYEDIPEHDVPCECGDLNHWIIKYR